MSREKVMGVQGIRYSLGLSDDRGDVVSDVTEHGEHLLAELPGIIKIPS